MKFLASVYSLPELASFSKEDKKKALKACRLEPFKSWKIWLSLLIFVFVPLLERLTFYSIFYALCSFGYLASFMQLILLRFAIYAVFLIFGLSLFMRIYNPVISACLIKYLSEKKL